MPTRCGTVLTVLSHTPIAGLLDNHAGYALRHGYRHIVADSRHVFGERQVALFKYQAIYRELVTSEESALLLVLDPFSVVYGDRSLDVVARGYDAIVTSQTPDDDLPTTAGMILRNTAAERERMRRTVRAFGQWAMYLPEAPDGPEPLVMRAHYTPRSFVMPLDNGAFASVQGLWDTVNFAFDALADAKPLVAHNAPAWKHTGAGWQVSAGYDFRYVTALLDEVRRSTMGVALARHAYETTVRPSDASRALHINPDAPLAFVSLYTSNIAGYARIHEENLVRYCLRHGYGYHLYRDTPDFLPEGVTANWAKLHLLRTHLKQHDFLFWIDADILAIDQSASFDDLSAGRDFVIGTDHTAWEINSCMIGMRNLPAMYEFANYVCEKIEEISDRSSVYASGGDQQVIWEAMQAFDLCDAWHIVDAMTLAASPVYATAASRFVHFPAQLNHYRAATMAVWNRLSRAR